MPSKASPKPTRLLSKARLRASWDIARKNGKRFKSYGTDGKSGEEFKANLDENLTKIAKELALGEYRFRDLRCRWIDKKGDTKKQRLICIPTVSDRLVQRAIANILEGSEKLKVFDRLGVKNSVSFGFQENLGVSNAIARALELRNSESKWAVKTDVISFFEQIDRTKLKARIKKHIPISLFPLIAQIIDCEVQAKDKSDKEKLSCNGIKTGRGLRQGMPLSPLLSNFEMRDFDGLAIKNNLKMVRYADDIVVFCNSESEAKRIYKNLVDWLSKLGHSIPALEEKKKTFIVPPNDGVEFLGLDIKFSETTHRYEVVLPDKTIRKILGETRRFSTQAACQEKKWDFAGFVKGMKSRNASLVSTYSKATNIEDFKKRLQIATNDTTRELLRDLFGAEVFNRVSDQKLRFLGVMID
jgi:RNA-directed DNA polymerase